MGAIFVILVTFMLGGSRQKARSRLFSEEKNQQQFLFFACHALRLMLISSGREANNLATLNETKRGIDHFRNHIILSWGHLTGSKMFSFHLKNLNRTLI